MKKYSLLRGVGKGLISLLSIGATLLALTTFSDLTIAGLVQTYLFPVLGSLTVGGVVTVIINWVKFHTTE